MKNGLAYAVRDNCPNRKKSGPPSITSCNKDSFFSCNIDSLRISLPPQFVPRLESYLVAVDGGLTSRAFVTWI